MKNLFFLLIAFMPLLLKAQLNEWLPNRAMTDSAHNNRNACLYDQYNEALLFWDQELNSTTTQLCYRSVYPTSLGDQHIALFQPDVKFTNPKIIELSQGSSSNKFILVYQTNEGNDIDLKYLFFRNDGTISEPAVLSAMPGDDINLCIYGFTIAWENAGKIFLSDYQSQNEMFSEPVLVETTGGFSPAFSNSWLQYLTTDNDNTTLKAKQYYYMQGNWVLTDSASKVFAGQCSGLNSSQPWFGMNLCMQQDIVNETSGIIIHDDMFQSQYLRSPSFNYTQPVICDYMIGVKSNLFILAYVSDSLAQKEVFALTPISGLSNVSQWPGEDLNPGIFVTFPSSNIIRANLFWESQRNGYSTIFSSCYDYLFGGTAEAFRNEDLTIEPCPFQMETSIRLRSGEPALIRIYNLQGQEIKTLSLQKESDGWDKAIWDGTNNSGNPVPPGCYAVIAFTGSHTLSRLVIKS